MAGLPPIRAKKLRFFDDPTFKGCVPPTDAQGRIAVAGHPLNPPVNLAARPYPYGPPTPAPAWTLSHAKPLVEAPQGESGGDGLEHAIATETGLDADASELSVDVAAQESDAASTSARSGVFGFDNHDRHQHADPDIGWNLPA